MTTDEFNNIDDLVDYQDFESGVEENNNEDSFNNDILKFYEERKKGSVEKTSEAQNIQRPMSKYQRSTSAKQNQENPYTDINLLLERFNSFIKKFNVNQTEFMDNPEIYLSLDDFKDCFKKIKFEITTAEAELLFCYGNESNRDGYILCKTFLENFASKIDWPDKFKTIYKTIEDKQINQKLNEEFKQMTKEIMNIVTKETNTRNSSRPKPLQNKIRPISSGKKSLQSVKAPELNSAKSENKLNPLRPRSFIHETLQKKKAEEHMIRLALEKRKRENERDCVKKMSEANEMAEHLGIPKYYSAFNDETESLICRVYDKNTKTTTDLELKRFLMDYKKLIKESKVDLF
jgi:hypothetical protein